MKIDLNKEEIICMAELQEVVSTLTPERIAAAHINLQQLLEKFSGSNTWLQMITYALPTLLEWYESRVHKSSFSECPNMADIMFAYIKSAVTQREQIMKTQYSGLLPKHLKEKTIEYILKLVEGMVKSNNFSVQVDTLLPSAWQFKFFGTPADPKVGQYLNLIRECAQDFIENNDGRWQFIFPEFPKKISPSVFLLPVSHVKAHLSGVFKDDMTTAKKALEIFIKTLLEHPEGVWVQSSSEDNPFATRYSCDDLCDEIKGQWSSRFKNP